mmetsp:Transcript_111168/g.313702  ORF Transcript_111168/g.313702 Transcript_111168/m.313702 type:complete len:733 (-) Transcript_111168:49-2247(-)
MARVVHVPLIHFLVLGSGASAMQDIAHLQRQSPIAAEIARETNQTTPMVMTLKAERDLATFQTAVIVNVFAVVVISGVFMIMRLRHPIVYSHNVQLGITPSSPEQTRFSWMRASLCVTVDQAIDSIGLDNAMLLEFTHLCMRILTVIGLPMVCVVGGMNWAFGGFAAGKDHLSYLSMGNVHHGSWLYWLHAVAVWGVVFVVKVNIHRAQRQFLVWRFRWLRKLPSIQTNTLLVEGIPEDFCSDKRLAEFFEDVLPEKSPVKKAYVAKDTSALMPLVNEFKCAESNLKVAEATWESDGKVPSKRPMTRAGLLGARVDSIDYYTQLAKDLKLKVLVERAKVTAEAAKGPGGVNLPNGFVTFHDRITADIVLRLGRFSEEPNEWLVLTPPEPNDVLWSGFTHAPLAAKSRALVGHTVIAGLCLAYLPLVVLVTSLARAIDMGPLHCLWAAFAPTMGLHVMVAMLPTFLMSIFRCFFTLKAMAFAQRELQIWYFWIQLVFVVVVTAVGQNLGAFMAALVAKTSSVFSVVVDTLPYATHFHMNFLVLQWAIHSMALTRYAQLSKYLSQRGIFDELMAKDQSEPEDQDCHGIGSRSVRFTINMVIAIVFGTLCPPINVLALVTFALKRLIYGYLLVFAETKKPDLGGVFWCAQLNHLFYGTMVYCGLMTGVFLHRASSCGPGLIAAPSILYVFWSQQRFATAFSWEQLPYKEVKQLSGTNGVKFSTTEGRYVQPEMMG